MRSGRGAGNLWRIIDAIVALQRAAAGCWATAQHRPRGPAAPTRAATTALVLDRRDVARRRRSPSLSPAAAFLPACEAVPGRAPAGAARLCPSGLGALGLGWDGAPSSTAKAAPAPAGPHPSCRGHANPLGEHREEPERPSSALGSEPSAALPGRRGALPEAVGKAIKGVSDID